MDKVALMNALIEAKKSLEIYEGLAKSAHESVQSIEQQLQESYQPEGSRYTADELASCRRDILGTLSHGWMYPRAIVDRLHNHSADLVMREVHKLAENSRSDVVWNQRKGPASQYRRYKAVV